MQQSVANAAECLISDRCLLVSSLYLCPCCCSTEPSVARTYLRKWVGDIGQGEMHCLSLALTVAAALCHLPEQLDAASHSPATVQTHRSSCAISCAPAALQWPLTRCQMCATSWTGSTTSEWRPRLYCHAMPCQPWPAMLADARHGSWSTHLAFILHRTHLLHTTAPSCTRPSCDCPSCPYPTCLQGATGQRDSEDYHHPRSHAARAKPRAPRQAPRLAAQEGGFEGGAAVAVSRLTVAVVVAAWQAARPVPKLARHVGTAAASQAGARPVLPPRCLSAHSSFPPRHHRLPPGCLQIQEKEDTFKQTKIDALFGAAKVRTGLPLFKLQRVGACREAVQCSLRPFLCNAVRSAHSAS